MLVQKTKVSISYIREAQTDKKSLLFVPDALKHIHYQPFAKCMSLLFREAVLFGVPVTSIGKTIQRSWDVFAS